jgi:hypothetical protein
VHNKRKFLLAAVAFVTANLCGSTLLAYAPVGPTTGSLKTGQWSLGADYSRSEIDFEIEWSSDYASGVPKSFGKEIRTDSYLAKYRYGFNEDWEISLFLGACEIEGKIGNDIYDSDREFNGGFGFKWTFLREEDLSWGLAYQMDWMMGEDSYIIDMSTYGFGTNKADVELDSFDIFLALGPTLKMDNLSMYAGAALYYYDADIKVKYLNTTVTKGNVDEVLLGGYGGATLNLDENIELYAEYMYSEDAWAMGGGFAWRF